MMKIINVDNITMDYSSRKKKFRALDNVSFNINQGDIVGIIGSNGAGKSTLIKILTGVLKPTEGEVIVNEVIPWKGKKAFKKEIGIVFGQRSQLWWELPVIDSFRTHQVIYEKNSSYTNNFLDEFDKATGIKKLLDKPARQLSLGQRMLCDIGLALYHKPKILFLDEPTIGLDAGVKASIRFLIKEINQKYETTFLLTSHDLMDIQETCTKVILLNKGEIIYDNELTEFIQKFDTQTVVSLIVKDKNDLDILMQTKPLINAKYIRQNTLEGQIIFEKNKKQLNVILKFISENIDYEDITINRISIEEIVKKVYTEGKV